MIDFHVYILKCSDGSYYIGHTSNLEQRIAEHNAGGYSIYTATRRPFSVVFIQTFATRDQAINMERRIKGWSRPKKEALINGDWDEIKRLSNLKKFK